MLFQLLITQNYKSVLDADRPESNLCYLLTCLQAYQCQRILVTQLVHSVFFPELIILIAVHRHIKEESLNHLCAQDYGELNDRRRDNWNSDAVL